MSESKSNHKSEFSWNREITVINILTSTTHDCNNNKKNNINQKTFNLNIYLRYHCYRGLVPNNFLIITLTSHESIAYASYLLYDGGRTSSTPLTTTRHSKHCLTSSKTIKNWEVHRTNKHTQLNNTYKTI